MKRFLLALTALLFAVTSSYAQMYTGRYNLTPPTYVDGQYVYLHTDINGNLTLGGVTAGSTDAGGSTKVGGVFTTTPATLTNGQRGDLQLTTTQKVLVDTAVANTAGDAQGNAWGLLFLSSAGSAPLAVMPQIFNGTTWDREFTCPNTAAVSVTAASTTQIVALSGTTVIRVCSVSLGISATGTVNVVTGTGTNCATPTVISNPIPLVTGSMWTQSAAGQGSSLFRSTAGGEICIAAATGNVTGFITYAQF